LGEVKDAALVQLPNGVTGWVRMPNLSAVHSEVIDFAGGVIRILRHDWSGALQLSENVVENPRTPLAVLVDAYLYLGIAADKMR